MEPALLDDLLQIIKTYVPWIFIFVIGRYGVSFMVLTQIILVVVFYMSVKNHSKLRMRRDSKDTVNIRPPWVVYPDIYKADWVNKLIKHIWPLLESHVRILLEDLAKDISITYLHKYGINLEINLFKIGRETIRVIGAKVHDIKERTKINL